MPKFCLLLFLLVFVGSCTNGSDALKQKPNDPEIDLNQKEKSLKIQLSWNSPAENVHCGFMDAKGNLWFGTTGYGVFKYDGKWFTSYSVKDGLGDAWVTTICDTKDGEILLGTGNGLYVYDNGIIKPFLNTEALNNQQIKQLYRDQKEQIWVATASNGIYIYNGQNLINLLQDIQPTNNLGLSLNGVSGIAEDDKGNIWLATWPPKHEGLIHYDGETLMRFDQQYGFTDSLFHCVIKDANGRIWLGSRNNGVFTYNGESFTKMFIDEPLKNEAIYDMIEDSEGNIWFTTETNGVYKYDGDKLENFTIKNGLANNSVFSVLEDSEGNLWFGARDVSLSRYDGEGFIVFSE